MKPLGKTPVKKGKDVFDATALFVKETLELEEPLEVISPFVQTYENLTLLLEGKLKDVNKQVLTRFRHPEEKGFRDHRRVGRFF